MNEFYEWLYDHYAEPRYDDSRFPSPYQDKKRQWEQVLQKLPPDDQITALDMLSSAQIHWGTQAFAYGVHIGLLLGADLPGEI